MKKSYEDNIVNIESSHIKCTVGFSGKTVAFVDLFANLFLIAITLYAYILSQTNNKSIKDLQVYLPKIANGFLAPEANPIDIIVLYDKDKFIVGKEKKVLNISQLSEYLINNYNPKTKGTVVNIYAHHTERYEKITMVIKTISDKGFKNVNLKTN